MGKPRNNRAREINSALLKVNGHNVTEGVGDLYALKARPELTSVIEEMREAVRKGLEDQSPRTMIKVYKYIEDFRRLFLLSNRFLVERKYERAVDVRLADERSPADVGFCMELIDREVYAQALRIFSVMYSPKDRADMERFTNGETNGDLRQQIKNHIFRCFDAEKQQVLKVPSGLDALLQMLRHVNDTQMLREVLSQAETTQWIELQYLTQSYLGDVARKTSEMFPGSFTAKVTEMVEAMKQGRLDEASKAALSLLEMHGIPPEAQVAIQHLLSFIPKDKRK